MFQIWTVLNLGPSNHKLCRNFCRIVSSVTRLNQSSTFLKAKLEAKKVREEREEQCRQQEDIEEAIYKAAERKKSIKHAKTLTFAQTDRVKGFHGALILTEVLKEREAQLELKKERLQAQVEREKRLHLKEVEALSIDDEEERKAATRRMRRTKEVQKYQLAQIKRKSELMSETLEGLEIIIKKLEHFLKN